MRRTPNQFVMLVGGCLTLVGSSHSAWAERGGCVVDLNGNGMIEIFDVLDLLQSWGPCRGCNADFNEDGIVDGQDLGYQMGHIAVFGHYGVCTENLGFPVPANIELVVVEITDPETGSQGLREFDLLAVFDEPTHLLLNVLDANASCDDPPCWEDLQEFPSALPLPEIYWEIFDLTYDCFVTVGAEFSDDNSALLADPNLLVSEQDFVDGITLGPNAGWVAIPGTDQGLAGSYPDNQIRIATFTMPLGKTIEGELSIIYQNSADQLFIGTESFLITSSTCPWDLDENGDVGVSDLLSLLAQWGADPGGPPDFDFNGIIGISDLLALLANWGPCP